MRTDATDLGRVASPIIENIVYPAVEVLFAVAVLVFVFGVMKLVMYGDDEKKRGEGKSAILYGVIGMFIMVSAWGIVHLVSRSVFEFIR